MPGRLDEELREAEHKAIDALARYKFFMFGYWAAIWVHLNRISGGNRPSPFKRLVATAREIKGALDIADTCLWRLDADGYYATQCGQAYTAFAEGLDENHYRYCPSCGGTIVSASEVLAQMEDE